MKNDEAIAALAALAQATRLETFRLLVKHEPHGVAAGELARSIDVPQNTLSAHLAILSRAGLVIGERHSRTIIYRANLEGFRELTLFMIQDCCGGNAELCAPLLESLQPCCPKQTSKVPARKRSKT
jgi:ArsR family transcriptional regulator